jgi:hypothetical protein
MRKNVIYDLLNTSLTECNSDTTQKLLAYMNNFILYGMKYIVSKRHSFILTCTYKRIYSKRNQGRKWNSYIIFQSVSSIY